MISVAKTSSSASSSSILSHPAASTISSPLLVVASTPANFPANSRTKKLVLFLLSSSVSVKFSRFSLLAFSDWSFFSCPRIRLHQRCSSSLSSSFGIHPTAGSKSPSVRPLPNHLGECASLQLLQQLRVEFLVLHPTRGFLHWSSRRCFRSYRDCDRVVASHLTCLLYYQHYRCEKYSRLFLLHFYNSRYCYYS